VADREEGLTKNVTVKQSLTPEDNALTIAFGRLQGRDGGGSWRRKKTQKDRKMTIKGLFNGLV
jgi:hypothetical protein